MNYQLETRITGVDDDVYAPGEADTLASGMTEEGAELFRENLVTPEPLDEDWTPVVPTIHLNGTGGVSLETEYSDLYDQFKELEETLAQATWHPRDFYVQEDGAWEKAVRERNNALQALRIAKSYFTKIYVGIADQRP